MKDSSKSPYVYGIIKLVAACVFLSLGIALFVLICVSKIPTELIVLSIAFFVFFALSIWLSVNDIFEAGRMAADEEEFTKSN